MIIDINFFHCCYTGNVKIEEKILDFNFRKPFSLPGHRGLHAGTQQYYQHNLCSKLTTQYLGSAPGTPLFFWKAKSYFHDLRHDRFYPNMDRNGVQTNPIFIKNVEFKYFWVFGLLSSQHKMRSLFILYYATNMNSLVTLLTKVFSKDL